MSQSPSNGLKVAQVDITQTEEAWERTCTGHSVQFNNQLSMETLMPQPLLGIMKSLAGILPKFLISRIRESTERLLDTTPRSSGPTASFYLVVHPSARTVAPLLLHIPSSIPLPAITVVQETTLAKLSIRLQPLLDLPALLRAQPIQDFALHENENEIIKNIQNK